MKTIILIAVVLMLGCACRPVLTPKEMVDQCKTCWDGGTFPVLNYSWYGMGRDVVSVTCKPVPAGERKWYFGDEK
jgi:hypothetical protein